VRRLAASTGRAAPYRRPLDSRRIRWAALEAAARGRLLTWIALRDQQYKPGPVHHHLAALLEKVSARKLRRLVITIPPQHGKSRLAAVEWPAWVLGNRPQENIALASYAADLAQRHTRQARDVMETPLYKFVFPRCSLNPDVTAGGDYETTGGGGYRGVGIGGPLTGRRVDLLVVDDPLKNFAEAMSRVHRENVWQWFLSTAYTRLQENGCCVIVQTRWHRDDLVGRLTNPERIAEMKDAGIDEHWHIVNLPALAGEADPLGRAPGEALAPSRFDQTRLGVIKATLGSFLWSALYQGTPRPSEKGQFSGESVHYVEPGQEPDGLFWVRFWDLATKEKQNLDRTASIEAALDDAGNLWLRRPMAGRWKWGTSRSVIAETAVANPEIMVGIEAVGGFSVAAQNAREVIPPEIMVRQVTVALDKLTRALPWLALAEAGKFYLVRDRNTADFIAELEDFPDGEHDDYVDAVSGAYKLAKLGGSRVMLA